MALHFVLFADKTFDDQLRFMRAVRIFGPPDFVHRVWDVRAACEIVEGDVAVFAKGTIKDAPSFYPYTEDETYSYRMQTLCSLACRTA